MSNMAHHPSISSSCYSSDLVENTVHVEPKSNHDDGFASPDKALSTKGRDLEQIITGPRDGTVLDGEKYKTMCWWQASVVMVAETVSLGILSLPSSLASLGLVPGALLIFFLGTISIYTGYALYQFKAAHPQVASYADAGELLAGKVGKWVADIMLLLNLVFIMAAHVLTFSVMLNTLTNHGACTIIFTVVGLAVCIIFTLPRALRTTSYFSIFSCLSIVAAAFVALINIAHMHLGIDNTYIVTPTALTSYGKGAMAVSNMIVAFTGHMAYFNIIDEMKQPEQFPKALCVTQSSTLTLYLIIGVVVYYYAGQDVRSPALNSASPLVSKISYGVAIPTIIVAGVIAAMVACKTLYARVWRRNPKVTEEDSVRAWASWIAIVVVLWFAAWVIANAIPVFSQLIGLLGATLGSWICLGFPALFWLHLNHRRGPHLSWSARLRVSYGRSCKKMGLTALNLFALATCVVLCVSGAYGSIKDIIGNPPDRHPFSCASNA